MRVFIGDISLFGRVFVVNPRGKRRRLLQSYHRLAVLVHRQTNGRASNSHHYRAI
jgi:hypothetical protein